VGGAGNNNQPNNATQQRNGGGRGGRGGRGGGIPNLKDSTTSLTDITRLPDGSFAGKGKEAKRVAAEWNKQNSIANASATTPDATTTPLPSTEKYTEIQLVNIIATLKEDGEDAAGYERRLETLRAGNAAPKTPSVAHAKRLAEQAETRFDKAAAKLDGLMAQVQAAQADTELAALQLQQANATYDKLLDEERANRGTITSGLTTGPPAPTISIDKIMLGEFPKLDLGSAAGYFQGDPEAMQRFEAMHAGIANHMQEGITNFVLQNKERWEATQKELQQLVEESSAKKRKQADTEPPSPERTGNSACTMAVDFVLPTAPVAVPAPTPQLPPNQVGTAQGTQAAEPTVQVPTEEARAATADAEKAARLNRIRADAMAKAALQMAKASNDKPVGTDRGMDCTS